MHEIAESWLLPVSRKLHVRCATSRTSPCRICAHLVHNTLVLGLFIDPDSATSDGLTIVQPYEKHAALQRMGCVSCIVSIDRPRR